MDDSCDTHLITEGRINIKDRTASQVINGDVDNLEPARTATDVQEVQRGHFQEK